MLSAENRFHRRNSIKRVYRLARPVRARGFTVYINKSNTVRVTRVAVVVSKKVHKSAVKRNRIRRRVYEVFRLIKDNFISPVEIVLVVYSLELIDMPYDDLSKSIKKAVAKAGVLK